MQDVLPHRRPLEMQFGYSCTAIPTILSGATPAEHGHLGLFRFAPLFRFASEGGNTRLPRVEHTTRRRGGGVRADTGGASRPAKAAWIYGTLYGKGED